MSVYVALGDSISIDDYTGVPGGGAASQLARRGLEQLKEAAPESVEQRIDAAQDEIAQTLRDQARQARPL